MSSQQKVETHLTNLASASVTALSKLPIGLSMLAKLLAQKKSVVCQNSSGLLYVQNASVVTSRDLVDVVTSAGRKATVVGKTTVDVKLEGLSTLPAGTDRSVVMPDEQFQLYDDWEQGRYTIQRRSDNRWHIYLKEPNLVIF